MGMMSVEDRGVVGMNDDGRGGMKLAASFALFLPQLLGQPIWRHRDLGTLIQSVKWQIWEGLLACRVSHCSIGFMSLNACE